MTLRTKLFAAAAAVALPSAMAGAQVTTPPTPPAGTSVPTPPTTTPPVADTEDRATQASDEATRRAEEAADEVEADAETDVQAQTTPPTQPPAQGQAPAEAQTEAQAQTSAPAEAQTQARAQAQTSAPAGPVSPASQADFTAGAMVHDQQGGMVGTIESADATGAVVSTGTVRARLPLSSFGRNTQGLVIAMTRVQLEAAVAAQRPPTPTPGG